MNRTLQNTVAVVTGGSVRHAALGESLVGRYVEPGDVAAAVNFFVDPGHSRLHDKSFASMGDSHSAVFEQGVL